MLSGRPGGGGNISYFIFAILQTLSAKQQNEPFLRQDLPSRPKLLQKNSLQRKCFEAINFVKITKQSLYKANSLACFLAKRDTAVAATLQRKSFGGILFVIITKKITKIIVPRNYFVIILARMVPPGTKPIHAGKSEVSKRGWREGVGDY